VAVSLTGSSSLLTAGSAIGFAGSAAIGWSPLRSLVCGQNMAIGLTGMPVMPWMRGGATVRRKL
jgi:hypothetical protein